MPDKDYDRMPVKEALEDLETSREGLSAEEVQKRREEYGENALITGKQTSRWLMFLSQFKDVLVLVLVFAGIASYSIALGESYVWGAAAVFLGAWEALKFRRRARRGSSAEDTA